MLCKELVGHASLAITQRYLTAFARSKALSTPPQPSGPWGIVGPDRLKTFMPDARDDQVEFDNGIVGRLGRRSSDPDQTFAIGPTGHFFQCPVHAADVIFNIICRKTFNNKCRWPPVRTARDSRSSGTGSSLQHAETLEGGDRPEPPQSTPSWSLSFAFGTALPAPFRSLPDRGPNGSAGWIPVLLRNRRQRRGWAASGH
jgi:hypothetical protein